MLKIGLNAISYLGRVTQKATEEIIDAVGLEKEVDSFQKTVSELPLVDHITKYAKIAKDEVFGEKLPLYGINKGKYPVKIYKNTFHDEKRDRDVPLTVYHPKEGVKNSPVVVFSHGLAANSVTYRYLGKHLASHGYTVLQPTHVGSDTKATLLKTIVFSFTQQELVDRKEDLSFALDLLEDGQLPDEVTDSANTDKVAVAGHSFGGLTSQVMAGVEALDEDGNVLPLQDERVDAFVAVSPYGDSLPSNLLGFDLDSYKNIEKPVLFMHGEKDDLFTLGKGPNVHSLPFHEASSEDKYQVIVKGARHSYFAQAIGIFDPETVDLTKSSTLAFLDAHLKEDPEAKSYLKDELSEVARSRGSQAFG